MKKYGKYEKRPEGSPAKQPKVKNVLLQTYFTSLLSLVLCVTMFFGTSYAWFTSEASNTGNEIYVGTLKVGLYKKADEKLVNLATSENNEEKLFDGNIRWEPGYTALETIIVKNEGDLAFNYELRFTEGSLAEGSEMSLADVAKHFDVWVYDHYEKPEPELASYADITAEGSGWTNAGSLDELLAGETVLENVMITVRDSSEANTEVNKGTTDGVPTEDTYTIALHMKEDADATVMGQKISLNVKLIAYQMTYETDAFKNTTYDSSAAAASDAASLKDALNTAGSSVQLITDVAIEDVDSRVTMNGGTLYGNGKTLTYSGGRDDTDSSLGVLTTTGGTIEDLTIVGSDDGRALYITNLASDLYVSDCVLSGAYAFNLNSDTKTEHTLNFVNTTFKSWTSYANAVDCVNFTGCTFENTLRPYGDTTLTDCTFTTEGLDVSCLEAGETITLLNCTYNGVTIEKAVLKADSEAGIATVEGALSGLSVVDGVLKTANG